MEKIWEEAGMEAGTNDSIRLSCKGRYSGFDGEVG